MGHQNRFDWNFAFDHGTQTSVPPSPGFLCNRMRAKPKMRPDFRLASVENCAFFRGRFPQKGILSHLPPQKKSANLARRKLAMLLPSSCYLRVDETVDPPIKKKKILQEDLLDVFLLAMQRKFETETYQMPQCGGCFF